MNDVVILHGWGSRAENWSTVKKFLERDGFKVHVPDLPGFGQNRVPPTFWSVDDYVEWVKGYCSEKNLSQFFLVGHSFGGGIAVKFASLYPKKVRGLVLVDAAIKRMKTPKYYLSLIVAKAGNLILVLPLLSRLKPILRRIFYRLIGTRDYQKLDSDKTNIMKETFKRVVSEDLMCHLPAVRAETLVVWGERDEITPLKEGYLINGGLPNSRLEIIEGVKHAPNLEAPDVLAEKISNFIKSL